MLTLRTLPQALRDAAGRGHGCLFIGAASGDQHAGVHRTYADLHAAALGVSGALRHMGLRRGDVVALALDDAEAFLTVLYGASMAGALPASLHPPGATRDLESYCDVTAGVLKASGARALVTSGRVAERFDRLPSACPKLKAVVS